MKLSKSAFYILSFTWGIILTVIGLLVALVLLCAGKKPKKWGRCIYFEVGKKKWGGMELGIVFLTNKDPSVHTRNHEHGHAIQNCYFGPIMPFIVCIPSAVRWWLRKFKDKESKTLFASIVGIIFIIAGATIGVISMFTKLWVLYLGSFIFAYGIILIVWLLNIEIPKYDIGYVEYDSIWFEKQATDWGNRYMED